MSVLTTSTGLATEQIPKPPHPQRSIRCTDVSPIGLRLTSGITTVCLFVNVLEGDKEAVERRAEE